MNWEIRTIINQETPRVDFRMLNKTAIAEFGLL